MSWMCKGGHGLDVAPRTKIWKTLLLLGHPYLDTQLYSLETGMHPENWYFFFWIRKTSEEEGTANFVALKSCAVLVSFSARLLLFPFDPFRISLYISQAVALQKCCLNRHMSGDLTSTPGRFIASNRKFSGSMNPGPPQGNCQSIYFLFTAIAASGWSWVQINVRIRTSLATRFWLLLYTYRYPRNARTVQVTDEQSLRASTDQST